MSLSAKLAPVAYKDEGVTYRAWEHTISGLWDGYGKLVRVVRSEETKTVRHHSDELGKWDIINLNLGKMGRRCRIAV